jgi:glutathione S-transferase
MARIAEDHLKGREFLLGERVSVGDFVLAYTLDWANEVRLLDHCPTLRAYIDRMYARPAAALRISEALRSVGL